MFYHLHISFSDIIFEGSQNALRLTVQMQPIIRCNFDLLKFPWDIQVCAFNVSITNVQKNNSDFTLASRVKNLQSHALEEYILDDVSGAAVNKSNTYTVSLKLERRYQQYICDTYLPSALLLAIGYGTLFLPVEPFNDRGTMSLTTLLVLVALYTDSRSELPGTAYSTHSDIWYIFSMVYLGSITAMHLFTASESSTVLSSRLGHRIQPALQLKQQQQQWHKQPHKHHCKCCIPLPSRRLWYSRIFFATVFTVFLVFYAGSVMWQEKPEA